MRICTALFAIVLLAPLALAQERNVEVPLDTTGVADWTFVNPASVPAIDGASVIFHNTTADRTFVVKMPFVLPALERTSAFAAAKLRRGGWSLRDVVCAAINSGYDPAKGHPCFGETVSRAMEGDVKDALDRVEELRIYLEAVDGLEGVPPLPADCPPDLYSPRCVVERLYWTTGCSLCKTTWGDRSDQLNALLREEAKALVLFLIQDKPTHGLITLDETACPLFRAFREGRLITTTEGQALRTARQGLRRTRHCRGKLPRRWRRRCSDRCVTLYRRRSTAWRIVATVSFPMSLPVCGTSTVTRSKPQRSF